MGTEIPHGLIAPVLTPFNEDQSIATELFVAHAKRLLDQGCVAIAPFGTTGEATSIGIDERLAALQALVDADIDPTLLLPGVGLCNVTDTARLARACLDLGCAGTLTLPPFYYKSVSEDGLYRYFAELIARIGPDARIFLYHIPPIAIVGIPPALARRLHRAFPDQVIGIKDSSGDWATTQALLEIDGLTVYPGSELPLLEALELGSPGCISATANVNAADIVRVLNRALAGDLDSAGELHAKVKQIRLAIQDAGPIPAQKRLLALATGDPRWATVRPPLQSMSKAAGQELAEKLRRDFGFEI